MPQAYIVYNPEATGLDLVENYMIAPHSGSQFLGCYATDIEMTDGRTNDDWLISRRLTGESQTITLWAKSLFGELPEKFEFLYSTSDQDVTHFNLLETVNPVPDQWTEYTYTLPEGSRHFAVRCVSEDKMLLMLDDITYQPEHLEILGYNIYRDGELIGQTDAATLLFEDNTANADCKYEITACYAEGESLPIVATKSAGIEEKSMQQVRISSVDGNIVISGAENQPVAIYGINGVTIYHSLSGTYHKIAVDHGFYIVQVGDRCTKVFVK